MNDNKINCNNYGRTYNTEDNDRWQRLDCVWQEQRYGHTAHHHYTPIIDTKTGDLYVDADKMSLLGKFLGHIVVRPFLIISDELYNLHRALSAPFRAAKTYFLPSEKNRIKNEKFRNEGTLGKKCLYKLVRPIRDLVARPLYGLALIVTSAAAIPISLVAPNKLFDLRNITGELIIRMEGRNKWTKTIEDMFICMKPITNINEIHTQFVPKIETNGKKFAILYKDTAFDINERDIARATDSKDNTEKDYYTKEDKHKEIGISNFSRAQICCMRNYYQLFNRPIAGRLHPDEEYFGPGYDKIEAERKKSLE